MRTDVFDEETRDHFVKAVEYCRGCIDSFDTDYRNILFCGTVGTGKSFLSCCIASDLIATYHSVVYMSAKTLFDTLAEAQFSREKLPEAAAGIVCGSRIELECDGCDEKEALQTASELIYGGLENV